MQLGFVALDQFMTTHNRLPLPWCKEDATELVAIARAINSTRPEADRVDLLEALSTRPIELLAYTAAGNLVPLSSMLGGYVAQEALKGVMDKYTPLHQCVYISCEEVIPVDLTQQVCIAQSVLVVPPEARPTGSRVRSCAIRARRG